MQWDTFNNLWDAIVNQWIWFSAAGVFLVLFVAIAAYSFFKPKHHDPRKPHAASPNERDGWTPTGRIDFVDPRSIGNFILQVEETRIIDSIGGVEHCEIRWRKATLDEAKTVVVTYHAQRNLAMAANFVVRSSDSDTRKFRPGEPRQQAQLGKDEAPD